MVWLRVEHTLALACPFLSLTDDDLFCTTPRLCQNNMTPVALRGRGTTSAYNCFPATGLFFKCTALALFDNKMTDFKRKVEGRENRKKVGREIGSESLAEAEKMQLEPDTFSKCS